MGQNIIGGVISMGSPRDLGHANRIQHLPESTLSDYDGKEHTTRLQSHSKRRNRPPIYRNSSIKTVSVRTDF